jgi:hypothetical protein
MRFASSFAPTSGQTTGFHRLVFSQTSIATQLPTDGRAVAVDLPGYFPLAPAYSQEGRNLVSLCLGQLSVSHGSLHFGR